jgi:hypothetical protein
LLSPFFIDAVEEERTDTGLIHEDIAEGNENPDTTGATNEAAKDEGAEDEDEDAVEAEGKNEKPTGDASFPDAPDIVDKEAEAAAAAAAAGAKGNENPTAATGLVPATVEGGA